MGKVSYTEHRIRKESVFILLAILLKLLLFLCSLLGSLRFMLARAYCFLQGFPDCVCIDCALLAGARAGVSIGVYRGLRSEDVLLLVSAC